MSSLRLVYAPWERKPLILDHESEGSRDSNNDGSSPGNNMPSDKDNTEGYYAGTVKGRAKAKFKTAAELLNPATAGSGPMLYFAG